MIVLVWLAFFFFWIFVLGCAVGSFLNVVIYRLPLGKSLFWPSSRCGACLQPIASRDNIPLLSYLRLRGRCRRCGATFSMRYFGVELLTGVLFVTLYAVEIGWNIHRYAGWRASGFEYLEWGGFAPSSWSLFVAHALLASLLLSAVACLLDTGHIPHSLAVTGVLASLGWNLLYPWPSPGVPGAELPTGFVPWPVWAPLPAWLPPGGWLLGLLTGLAGVLIGPALLRLTGADAAPVRLTMLAGGFLGWQPVVVALALGARAPLVLAAALVAVWFGWRWLGPPLHPFLFSPVYAPALLAVLALSLRLRAYDSPNRRSA